MKENPQGWKMVRHNEEMPLKASVRCGICDRPFTAYPQKGKYIYYKCPNNGCCVNIRNTKLHELFGYELSKFTVQEQLLPVIKCSLIEIYQMLHRNEAMREKPMKDELARLKNELEIMELNLATGKLRSDIFDKHSQAHSQKIAVIEAEIEMSSRDSSNLDLYINNALEIVQNLLKLWQLVDFPAKIRLQQLVFPAGLRYMPENNTLRTPEVNPIFSAITLISKYLVLKQPELISSESEKKRQVYLSFSSSNFFWENLEKTAGELESLATQPRVINNPVVSYSGVNPIFSAMTISQIIDTWDQKNVTAPGISQSSGTTIPRLYQSKSRLNPHDPDR